MQNRVNPFGDIISTTARGVWLGNRGNLHGNGKTILRPFKHKAWIICVLEFKGRHREIMAPNLWTELFFLDEATALAAGHRPCFECRREDAKRFKLAWLKGNPSYGFDLKTSITKIDEVLQLERISTENETIMSKRSPIAMNIAHDSFITDKNKLYSDEKVTFTSPLKDLPNGSFIVKEKQAYLVINQLIYLWSPFGYGEGEEIPLTTIVQVLTPKSIINAFLAGYLPQIK